MALIQKALLIINSIESSIENESFWEDKITCNITATNKNIQIQTKTEHIAPLNVLTENNKYNNDVKNKSSIKINSTIPFNDKEWSFQPTDIPAPTTYKKFLSIKNLINEPCIPCAIAVCDTNQDDLIFYEKLSKATTRLIMPSRIISIGPKEITSNTLQKYKIILIQKIQLKKHIASLLEHNPVSIGGNTFLPTYATEEYNRDPLIKKELWQTLQTFHKNNMQK